MGGHCLSFSLMADPYWQMKERCFSVHNHDFWITCLPRTPSVCALLTKAGKGLCTKSKIIFLYKEIQLPLLHIGEERQEPRLESSTFSFLSARTFAGSWMLLRGQGISVARASAAQEAWHLLLHLHFNLHVHLHLLSHGRAVCERRQFTTRVFTVAVTLWASPFPQNSNAGVPDTMLTGSPPNTEDGQNIIFPSD